METNMKKVAIIYKNSDNQEVITYLKDNLEKIFENYLIVENYYINELPINYKISADAYILTDGTMLYPLKDKITNYNNIIIMHRSLKKQPLYEISRIPKNTNVLVINDTYETAVQTLCSLYELGMNHLNLVPYDPKDAANSKYKDFQICITPNEVHLVPDYIHKIINIGYREISFDTLVSLMSRLDLDFELTNRNLVRHIKSIAEPDIYLHNNYLNNFVKNHVFDSVINDLPTALIITNEKYHILFSNNKAKVLFDIKNTSSDIPLSDMVGHELFTKLKQEITPKDGIVFNETNYFVEKTPIMLMDEVMGYYIILQNEKDLRDIEINARKI
jgi:hypothetical protein